jgi:hypothetical protein
MIVCGLRVSTAFDRAGRSLPESVPSACVDVCAMELHVGRDVRFVKWTGMTRDSLPVDNIIPGLRTRGAGARLVR